MSWNDHIQHVCNKISKACGALTKLRHYVPIQILIDVFNALIHSYLRYGILVWGSASTSNIQSLSTLVNKAIRIISFAPHGNLHISQLYKDLNLLNLQSIFKLELGKFLYKEKHSLLPTKIGNYFELSSNFVEHRHNTRVSVTSQTLNLVVRLKSSEKAVQFRGNKLWNSISHDLRSQESYKIFKRKFKKQLISEL